ncbi:MAG: glycosyltransferase [Actinomycetota bacterium]|nr:glycosyltransferase [Actinomycetota bacterium]
MPLGEHSVSVIIPTYNRADILSHTLKSYIQPHVVEIIVVDDASPDHMEELVPGLRAECPVPIKYLKHDRRMGSQISKNDGASMAVGDYVLIGEDDVLLADDYIELLLESIVTRGASIAAGDCLDVNIPGGTHGLAEKEITDFEIRENPAVGGCIFLELEAGSETPVETPNLCAIALIHNSLLGKLAFDPGYRWNSFREETDFYYRALDLGETLVYVPDARCYHLRGNTWDTGGHRRLGGDRLAISLFRLVNTWRFLYRNRRIVKKVSGHNWIYNCYRYVFCRLARPDRHSSAFLTLSAFVITLGMQVLAAASAFYPQRTSYRKGSPWRAGS